VFRVRPGSTAAQAEPLLAIGAELGARFLLTAVEDPELDRRAEVFAELYRLARGFGLRCMLEPMVFSALRTPADTLALIRAAGADDAGVLIDTLHLARAGGEPADLDELGQSRLPYVQLCDAASAEPAGTDAASVRGAAPDRPRGAGQPGGAESRGPYRPRRVDPATRGCGPPAGGGDRVIRPRSCGCGPAPDR
jgi:sugar phosphate isomerase/epimerase